MINSNRNSPNGSKKVKLPGLICSVNTALEAVEILTFQA